MILTGHKEETGGQHLQGDDSLATETAGKEDQDSTGGDVGSDLGGVADRARALGSDDIVSRVVLALGTLHGSGGGVLEGEFL